MAVVEWRRIPTVLRPDELIDKAFGRASKQSGLVDDPDRYHRVRKQMVRMIQSATDTLSTTLRDWISRWPSLDQLSPFDVALIDAAVGCDAFRQNLGAIQWAADRIDAFGRDGQRRIARQRRLEAFHDTRREVYGRCVSVLDQIGDRILWLGEARDTMRTFPEIDATEPCIVVAGAPNVGKSALIAALSTGEPEIAAYPFTTKRLHVGHFIHRRRMHQLVDTPGLLDRPMEERNDIEMQAIAALSHVGDLVLFLIDATEESGTPLSAQESLRDEIASILGDTPMITVVGKADLLGLDGWGEAVLHVESTPVERLPDTAVEAPLAAAEPVLEHPGLAARAVSPITGVGLRPLRSSMVEAIGAVAVGERLELPDGWHVRRIVPKDPIVDGPRYDD